jgi:hypothetical protein
MKSLKIAKKFRRLRRAKPPAAPAAGCKLFTLGGFSGTHNGSRTVHPASPVLGHAVCRSGCSAATCGRPASCSPLGLCVVLLRVHRWRAHGHGERYGCRASGAPAALLAYASGPGYVGHGLRVWALEVAAGAGGGRVRHFADWRYVVRVFSAER